MPVWIRLVLIWLIAITVPLKGQAAASMIGCGPVHQAAAGMAAEMAEHVHGEVQAEALQSPFQSAEPDAGNGPAPADFSKAVGHLLKMKCGNCSPCCAAAAPAVDPSTTLPVQPESTGVPFVDAGYSGVITDVPHRPPRFAYAA
jgi:hypothetical protein